MIRDVAVVHEGALLAECDSIVEAERLISLIEDCDPNGVHNGEYGIDASERADAQYQKIAMREP